MGNILNNLGFPDYKELTMILERRIQNLKPGLADEVYRDWEKAWMALEKRLGGFPPKRHYTLLSGQGVSGTVVWEREWQSFAEMEDAYMTKLFPDPETQKLSASTSPIVSEYWEYYWVDPDLP